MRSNSVSFTEFGFILVVGGMILLPYNPIFGLEGLYWLTLIFCASTFLGRPVSDFRLLGIYSLPLLLFILSGVTKAVYFDGSPKDDLIDLSTNMHVFIILLCTYNYFKVLEVDRIERYISILCGIIMFSLVVSCLIGLAQFVKFEPIVSLVKDVYELKFTHKRGHEFTNFELSEKLSRVNAIFSTPISFAGILGILMLLVQGLRPLRFATIGLLLLVLLLTNARTVTVVVIAILMIQNYGRVNIMRLLIGSLVVGVLLTMSASYIEQSNLERILEIYEYAASGFDADKLPATGHSRLTTIMVIQDYFANHGSAMWGMNLGDFNVRLRGYSFESQYFAWFCKYGIFGIAVSFWALYMVWYFRRKERKATNEESRKMFNALMLVFLAMALINVTQQVGFGRHLRELIFIAIGLIEAHDYSLSQNEGHR